jgi:hypothetical protein
MLRWRPQEVAFVGTRPQPAWELQALLPEEADRLDGAARPLESLKDRAKGALNLGVRIETEEYRGRDSWWLRVTGLRRAPSRKLPWSPLARQSGSIDSFFFARQRPLQASPVHRDAEA